MIPRAVNKAPFWSAARIITAALVSAFCAAAAIISLLYYLSPGGKPPPLYPGPHAINYPDFLNKAFFVSGEAGSVARKKNRNPFLPFDEYLVFKVSGPAASPYDVQLNLPTTRAIKAGDFLSVRFYIRRQVFSAPARSDFVFEQAGGEYQKSIALPVEAGVRWRMVEVSFRSVGDYPAGKASVIFRLGFGTQTVELAGMEFVNNGGDQIPLCSPEAGYEGREPGASWRKAAVKRIEKTRMGPIRVFVSDASGRPVSGAKLSVRQLNHAFSFGSAINSKYLYAGNREDNKARYRGLFLRLFNSATIENDLKWYFWGGERKIWADKTAAWLSVNNVALRGHTLVWPGWEHMPVGMENMKAEPEKLRSAIRSHITEEASYYRGRVKDWDVLNEPLDHSEIISLLGPAEPAEWFKLARRADPSAKLLVNDYGILNDMGSNSARHEAYKKFIRSLLENGAPLDGIGLQCHFGRDLTPPGRLISILDGFQKLGKPLYATELGISNPDERLQADYLRDFMTALFSHPAVRGITLWGFWEGVHSDPLPALYKKNWAKKSAALVLEDLLLKQWRTELSGVSDGNGEFESRGFYGSYEIEVVAGKSSKKVKADISKNGGAVTIVL